MKRIYHKKFQLLIFLLLIIANNITAQKQSKVELEIEIKTNSNYIYIQSIQGDTIEGKINASNILWTSEAVKEELLTNKNLKKTNIAYLIKPRGPKYKIIAYTNKLIDVTNKEKSKIDNPEKSKESIIIASPPTSDNVKPIKLEKKADRNNNIEKTSPVVRENTIPNKYKSSSEILNHLSDLDNFDDIIKYLKTEKLNNKLVYSYRADAFNENIERCYIIVFSANTDLLMVLDKGKEIRRNLLNSEMIKKEEFTNTKNIYVYEY